jgi:hypothetical protein
MVEDYYISPEEVISGDWCGTIIGKNTKFFVYCKLSDFCSSGF